MNWKYILSWLGVFGVVVAGSVAYAPNKVVHVGPEYLYPNPALTPGVAATLSLNELIKEWTDHCPSGKKTCTYSQDHRDVNTKLHTQVYDEYNVPQNMRNIASGEVDHFYPLCAGGSNDIKNLWYQKANIGQATTSLGTNLFIVSENMGYHEKDKLETYVCVQIKAGKLDPKVAFDRITTDWVKYYIDLGLNKNFVSKDPVE